MRRIHVHVAMPAFFLAAITIFGTVLSESAAADINPLSVESPVEFAEEVLALYASGAGVMMPVEDEPYVEDRTPLVRTLVDFPQTFLDGLVPVRFVHYDTCPITVRLDDETGAAVFYNADDVAFYVVQPTENTPPTRLPAPPTSPSPSTARTFRATSRSRTRTFTMRCAFPCEGDATHFCSVCGAIEGCYLPTEITPSRTVKLQGEGGRSLFSLSEGCPQTATWTIAPIVSNGPRLYTSETSTSFSTTLSDVSEVWVSLGSVPGEYQITASYDECHSWVENSDYTIRDHAVLLHLTPQLESVGRGDLGGGWRKKSGPNSGTCYATNGLDYVLEKPTVGGIYHFTFAEDESIPGGVVDSVVILPLGKSRCQNCLAVG